MAAVAHREPLRRLRRERGAYDVVREVLDTHYAMTYDAVERQRVHAVLWSVALNTFAGFRALSPTLRMVGQSYGLSRVGYVTRILIPGAFPSILTGLKVGWAFAWRTLIAAELVFGVSSGSGGLGWYIFENKNQLRIPEVFAGLLTVILFGLFVENVIFRGVERRTVRRWGMQT